MANQISMTAVENAIQKKSYYKWLCEKSGLEGSLARFLFEKDYVWEVDDDANRAKDGMELRNVYAEEVGDDLSPQMRDKLKKSVHGKCCILELLLSLANHIDAMVNDGEKSMAPDFVSIMLENLELDGIDDEDFDMNYEKTVKKILIQTDTNFDPFPLKNHEKGQTLWQNLNFWVDENTDDEGYFEIE